MSALKLISGHRIRMLAALVIFLTGCGFSRESLSRGGVELGLIETTPTRRPDWLDATPKADGRVHYFVGTSDNVASLARAQDLATAAALKSDAAYCGVSISTSSEQTTESRLTSSGISDPNIEETERVLQSARAYFSRFRNESRYVEHFGRKKKKRIYDSVYRVSVLLSIPADEIDAAVREGRKRHETAPEERVSMNELKREEAALLARVQTMRSYIDQHRRNEDLKDQISQLEGLRSRVEAGLQSAADAAQIAAQLDLLESKISGKKLASKFLDDAKRRAKFTKSLAKIFDHLVIQDGWSVPREL